MGIAKDSGSVEKRSGICPQASRIGEPMNPAGPTWGNDSMIEVTDLTKNYGHVLANDRIIFSVQRGEIVGLLGPNGAGKTTVMRILTGCLPATSGTASVGGYELSTHAVHQLFHRRPPNRPASPLVAGDEILLLPALSSNRQAGSILLVR